MYETVLCNELVLVARPAAPQPLIRGLTTSACVSACIFRVYVTGILPWLRPFRFPFIICSKRDTVQLSRETRCKMLLSFGTRTMRQTFNFSQTILSCMSSDISKGFE